MKKNITTIAELEREQEKLRMTMKVTHQEFARSLGTNRKQLKNFVIKKVALPIGAVGLGVSAISSLTSSNKKQKQAPTSLGMGFIGGLLPIAINLIEAFLNKKQTNKVEEKISETSQIRSKPKPLQTVA